MFENRSTGGARKGEPETPEEITEDQRKDLIRIPLSQQDKKGSQKGALFSLVRTGMRT